MRGRWSRLLNFGFGWQIDDQVAGMEVDRDGGHSLAGRGEAAAGEVVEAPAVVWAFEAVADVGDFAAEMGADCGEERVAMGIGDLVVGEEIGLAVDFHACGEGGDRICGAQVEQSIAQPEVAQRWKLSRLRRYAIHGNSFCFFQYTLILGESDRDG